MRGVSVCLWASFPDVSRVQRCRAFSFAPLPLLRTLWPSPAWRRKRRGGFRATVCVQTSTLATLPAGSAHACSAYIHHELSPAFFPKVDFFSPLLFPGERQTRQRAKWEGGFHCDGPDQSLPECPEGGLPRLVSKEHWELRIITAIF